MGGTSPIIPGVEGAPGTRTTNVDPITSTLVLEVRIVTTGNVLVELLKNSSQALLNAVAPSCWISMADSILGQFKSKQKAGNSHADTKCCSSDAACRLAVSAPADR